MNTSSSAAFAVGSYVGLSKGEIIEGVKGFSPALGRMDFIQCDRFLLVDSSFNANPASMKVAIDTLSGYNKKGIVVLGDMLELGAYSKQLHHELGAYVTACELPNIYLNELDKRVEAMASEFSTPALHCCSTVYSKARTYIYKIRRKYGKMANPRDKKELLKHYHISFLQWLYVVWTRLTQY